MPGIDDFFENTAEEEATVEVEDANAESEESTESKAGEAGEEKVEEEEEEEAGEAEDAADGEAGKAEAEDASGEAVEEKAPEGEALEAHEAFEVQSLRVLLREQSEELAAARERSQKLEEKLTSSGIIEDGDLDSTEEGVSEDRRASLAILAETMQMNPKYSDFEKVLDQDVFDETVLAMARYVVETDGGRLSDRIEEVTQHIWGLPNPYKYMYGVIKASHPSFKEKEEKKAKARSEASASPPSLQNLPGGSSKKDGWTAAKIDKMAEDDLSTVPEKVYDQYMRGLLA